MDISQITSIKQISQHIQSSDSTRKEFFDQFYGSSYCISVVSTPENLRTDFSERSISVNLKRFSQKFYCRQLSKSQVARDLELQCQSDSAEASSICLDDSYVLPRQPKLKRIEPPNHTIPSEDSLIALV
eukprot:757269-Hanusia_phi.AAC.9